jgi:hypothetical protein
MKRRFDLPQRRRKHRTRRTCHPSLHARLPHSGQLLPSRVSAPFLFLLPFTLIEFNITVIIVLMLSVSFLIRNILE